MSVMVRIRFFDGGLQEFEEDDALVDKLESLQSQGYTGKWLINLLLTDDWGTPPTMIEITPRGAAVILIPYS